ncbi:TPA: toll/interleukin-1 receptor domain-containing protein [Vibrio cholerae]|uniref:toll/interleukin-1 receptor domain-containing protein n=1 Tax=Vibrio cholerae TaxID=666 RepID=UPI00208C5626|nr:toll/interleukin-1 receptor domain-containing protein [Vibrio cholerae]EGR4159191.1 toll/interleukin-1 receptor domain-containing protein [Vibrio cholerae]EGR4425933.1 toll/interleukin-1 receptor domain-containing protein [Vibrio cholerae]EJL6560499.1 toll/interleukin-1 receptor domain-containing protein [Vibrio cholerae]ELB7342618.1 toll/interleukin-1 receptor domain-containing protein [Vibrio cholerae]ELC9568490.1 toll/interleukin-1 receptor domain-containing protein [Vibrio cholerae]
MKILIVIIGGKVKNPYAADEIEYDMNTTTTILREGIIKAFPSAEVVTIAEIKNGKDYIYAVREYEFDICICDLTSFNSNVSYIAGVIEGAGFPVIYCAPVSHGALPVISHTNTLLYSETSIANEFRDALNQEISRVMTNPKTSSSYSPVVKRHKAFISYSHSDREYLDRLLVHLKPLKNLGLIDIWEDSQIKTGDQWLNQIKTALEQSNIAILLISADFLASDFIVNNELPPLLSNAEVQGTKIVPVIVSPCRFARDPQISKFQAVNNPSTPLSTMQEYEREVIYDKLASEIESVVKQP